MIASRRQRCAIGWRVRIKGTSGRSILIGTCWRGRSTGVAAFVSDPGTEFVDGACLDNHFVCPAFSVPLEPAVGTLHAVTGLTMRVRPMLPWRTVFRERNPQLRGSWIGSSRSRCSALQRVITCRAGTIALTIEAPQDEPFRVGDLVHLRIDPAQVFDSKAGPTCRWAALGRPA